MNYPKGITRKRAERLLNHIREMAEIVGGKPGLNDKGRRIERDILNGFTDLYGFCPVDLFAPEIDEAGRKHGHITIMDKMIYHDNHSAFQYHYYPLPYEESDENWWNSLSQEMRIGVFNWLKTVEW